MNQLKSSFRGVFNRKFIGDFARYVVAGVSSVVVQFGLLVGLIEFLHTNATFASAVGFVLGCVVNYLLLYYWAFSTKGKHFQVIFRYMVVMTITLVFNVIIFWWLHVVMGVSYLVSQTFATSITALGNYLLNRKYAFA